MRTHLSDSPWQNRYPEAWQDFQQARPDGSVSDFVHTLFEQQLIALDDLAAHYLSEAIEVTQVESLSELSGSSPPPEDRYALQDKLGQGAMGVVYLAKDQALLRQVAYKALLYSPDEPLPGIAVRRFLNEVQITAQLDHPHIIPIYQLLPSPDGGWGYTMKRIQGQTLKEILLDCRKAWDQQPDAVPEQLGLEALLEIFLKVCDAMAYAHLKGVIHRDLKPANLMIGPHQEVYVMDWGIARRISDSDTPGGPETAAAPADPDATQLGQILGTPRYMSPQQAAGKNSTLDGRSDLFSLGLILAEILTLQPVFQAPDQISLLKKVLKAELPPLQPYHPRRRIPAPLVAVVQKATARRPEGRYASVAEMAHDLRLWLQGEPVSVYSESRWEQSLRWVRRHAYTVGISTLGVISGCLLLIGGSVFYQLQLTRTAQHEQQVLAAVFSTATQRAQAADQVFLSVQSHLSGLMAAARQALQQPPGTTAVYFTPDFARNADAPPDFGAASAYGRAISLQWPGVQIAESLNSPQARQQARQLMALRQRLWQMFSAGQDGNPAAAAAALRERGGDLVWAYIGLGNGLHLNYPGKGGYAADYDPRQRPWYRAAEQQPGIFWGAPYADASGQGLLLPCLGGLRGPEQELLGVAGLEISLSRFMQRHLLLPEHPEVRQIFMLDAEQRLLAQTRNQPEAAVTVYDSPKAWQPDSLATEQATLAKGQSSHIQAGDRLWVSIFLPSIRAYYVLEIPQG